MAGPTVDAVSGLLLGLNTNFRETYDREITQPAEPLPNLMKLALPSDGAYEREQYWESLPQPQRWDRGKDIPRDTFKGRVWTTKILDWAIAIPIHENDINDSRVGSLLDRAGQAASGFAVLVERVFFQLLTAATDALLLDSIPLCPDGAALFSATASGAARFGKTGGNIVQSDGIDNQEQVKSSFYKAMVRQLSFTDTKGQTQINPKMLSQGYTIVYPLQHKEVFDETFGSNLALKMFLNASGDPAAATAIQNVLTRGDIPVTLWGSPRLTSDSWYIGLNGYPTKGIYQYERQAPRDNISDMLNSDRARTKKEIVVQYDSREGYGYALPIPLMKVSG